MSATSKKYLVTGGGGFLGRALCLELLSRGASVVSVSRGFYPELRDKGVDVYQHDIREPFGLELAAKGPFDGVFHTASKVDMWGKYQDFYKVNVQGTQNVIAFCHDHGIKKLVYTSSPSVIADGSDTAGVDESYPYPKNYIAPYPATKALAEQEVLGANNSQLSTVALRPHLIWGPGDRHLVPTILERAHAGRLVQVGNGTNKVDTSFIFDCVNAHILGMEALDHKPNCAGKAYFISQGQPVPLWGWIAEILKRNNMPAPHRRISAKAAYYVGALMEGLSKVIPFEPFLTRFLASQMSCDHYFDISNAEKDLQFRPKYSMDEALNITFPNSVMDQGMQQQVAV